MQQNNWLWGWDGKFFHCGFFSKAVMFRSSLVSLYVTLAWLSFSTYSNIVWIHRMKTTIVFYDGIHNLTGSVISCSKPKGNNLTK